MPRQSAKGTPGGDMGRRTALVESARRTLAADPTASIAVIARDAGVSRATFYRYFPARAALLDALDMDPDPGTGERILAAAMELLARDGLARLSMDDVADRAGVSRASVYRLYAGKTALFGALLVAKSPFREISDALHPMRDRPPEEVLPMLLGVLDRVAGDRLGMIRALMFEVTAGSPEAVEASRSALQPVFTDLSTYFAAQMDAGRIRRMHPILAAQALAGPLIFHLLGRSIAGSFAGPAVPSESAAAEFAGIVLRGLAPDPTEE